MREPTSQPTAIQSSALQSVYDIRTRKSPVACNMAVRYLRSLGMATVYTFRNKGRQNFGGPHHPAGFSPTLYCNICCILCYGSAKRRVWFRPYKYADVSHRFSCAPSHRQIQFHGQWLSSFGVILDFGLVNALSRYTSDIDAAGRFTLAEGFSKGLTELRISLPSLSEKR